MKKESSFSILILTGAFSCIIFFFLSLLWGTKSLSFNRALLALLGRAEKAGDAAVLFSLRFPRALAAFVCGASLSCAGLLLQSSLNNALASPGVIGVNTGAGFFVLLGSLFFPLSVTVKVEAAFLGAMLSCFLVYGICMRAGVSKTSVILSGVAVSSLFSAGIDLLLTTHPEIVSDKVSFSLGGFSSVPINHLFLVSIISFVGILLSFLLSPGLDLFPLGDEAAFSLGLNVRRHRIFSILVASLLASGSVSLCGLLGFVGLLVPNLVRLFSPVSSRKKLLLCILWGGAFLLFCDFLSRVLFFPYEVPVGLFLSCLGAPFFIFMLIKKRRRLEA